MRSTTCRTIVLFLVAAALQWPATALSQDGFKIVVNSINPLSSIERQELSRIFLKRVTRWDDGAKIEPFDQERTSPVRKAFSQIVHERTVESVHRWWNGQIFAGRSSPPTELGSDSQILELVRSSPRAIGYVSAEAPIGSGVKVLEILN